MSILRTLSALVPQPMKGLSAKLIFLTVFFVLLGEVLIYIPSIARFRAVYLQDKVDAAHLATAPARAMPELILSDEAEEEMLTEAGVIFIQRDLPSGIIVTLGSQEHISNIGSIDLSRATPSTLIFDALEILLVPQSEAASTYAKVRGGFQDPGTSMRNVNADHTVAVILSLGPLRLAMIDYSLRIFILSIVMSLIVALLVFLSLHLLMVRPIRALTASMLRFRKAPEDAANVIEQTGRTDEIGQARTELASMQHELRQALHQRSNLAAVGAAITKISHDLRNTLASAQLVTDRLSETDDPEIARQTAKLTEAIDRAITLATDTLRFGRADELSPQKTQVRLARLAREVGDLVAEQSTAAISWAYDGPEDLELLVDADHLHRILLNLGRNAAQAIERSSDRAGDITVRAEEQDHLLLIQISDTGPGMTDFANDNLFMPFKGSTGEDGTGLGLPIAHELMRANGGTIMLKSTGPTGTVFELCFPTD